MWEVVDRHFDEAEFLAERWRDAFDEPDITLTELASVLERRLIEHLDGLTIAGAATLEHTLWPALRDEEAPTSLALVASLAVLTIGELADCRRLLELLGESEPNHERWIGIVEALALSQRSGLDKWLVDALDTTSKTALAGVASTLARRQAALGSKLDPLLTSDDVHVLAAAATLARHGDRPQLGRAAVLAQHSHPLVAAAAIETSLVCAVDRAIDTARYWAFDAASCEFRSTALTWIGVLGQPADQQRLLALLGDPLRRRASLRALGFGGSVHAVEAVLPLLEHPELGPLAGEVMTAIVGLPTDDESLWRERMSDEHDGLPRLIADRIEAPPIGDPEQLLPIPDPAAVMAWWHTHGSSFDRSARLLAGVPLDDAVLAQALVQQPMRRRHALALLAQIRNPSATHVSTRTWAHLQLSHGSGSSSRSS
jgi:uncharacterized protein (TIGR02270 family)